MKKVKIVKVPSVSALDVCVFPPGHARNASDSTVVEEDGQHVVNFHSSVREGNWLLQEVD